MSTIPSKSTPTPSAHAKLRWTQRACDHDQSIIDAWRESYPVGLTKHRGNARLHPPTDTLLLLRSGHLTTVLQAAFEEYRADHLIECTRCSLQFQPRSDDRECSWCHYDKSRRPVQTNPKHHTQSKTNPCPTPTQTPKFERR